MAVSLRAAIMFYITHISHGIPAKILHTIDIVQIFVEILAKLDFPLV